MKKLDIYIIQKLKNYANKQDSKALAYLKKQGENLATKEDISEITKMQEEVKEDFNSRLEELKSSLLLGQHFYTNYLRAVESFLADCIETVDTVSMGYVRYTNGVINAKEYSNLIHDKFNNTSKSIASLIIYSKMNNDNVRKLASEFKKDLSFLIVNVDKSIKREQVLKEPNTVNIVEISKILNEQLKYIETTDANIIKFSIKFNTLFEEIGKELTATDFTTLFKKSILNKES